MKPTRTEKVYITLLIIVFGGIVLHAPLSVGLGVVFPDYSLLVKSWKEIIMALAFPIALLIIKRRGLFTTLLNDQLIRLVALFAAVHLMLAALFYQGLSATAAGLAIDLRYLLFFFLMYIAILVMPGYRQRMVQIGIIGAFIVTGFAVVQLFLPADILTHIGYGKTTIAPYLTVDKNPNFIRENSTLRGPNPLGAYAGMVLGLLAAAWVRHRPRVKSKKVWAGAVVLAACSVVALWVSYSRSALIAGILAALIPLAVAARRTITRKTWIVAIIALLTVGGAAVASLGSSFVSNVLLHENPNGGSSVSSNEGHVDSLVTGWTQFIQQPLGDGVGSTGSASLFNGSHEVIENQYLFIAHEAGWLGLALFIAIFTIVLGRLWHQRQDWLALGVFAGGIGIASIGLLLPVWADDTVSIVWWGLAAIALGGAYEPGRNKAK